MNPLPELARSIEHTLLKAEATAADIDRLCQEAVQHSLFGVCVNPIFVARARQALGDCRVQLVSVVGFPLGAGVAEIVAQEARHAIAQGADEIDMVIPLGAACSGDWQTVRRHVRVLREASAGRVLKVILETGHFSAAKLERCAREVLEEHPDFLKTSSGFGPRGASLQDVQLLTRLCPAGVGVKASGGIRTREFALQLLQAGATRLGTSSGVAIAAGA
jgi:deoxyribose-phosphate aldolase